MVTIPQHAAAPAALAPPSRLVRGEVFWLPGRVVVYRTSNKRRPCLVAAVDAARAHLIPGTSTTASGPAVVVEADEIDLPMRTEFDFSVSFPMPLVDVVAHGQPAGILGTHRAADIDAAIAASNLVALKRLMRA